MEKKFGLITYQGITYPKTDIINVGDYIQSIAARQFLPNVDTYVSREQLHAYRGEDIQMIMNAWYMANPDHFPPAPAIDPLYVSIHINSAAKEGLTSPASIAHYKAHEPIGCRDMYTMDLLKAKGVDAYYSGCLTLTLGRTYKRDKPNDKIYIVDVMFDSLSTPELLRQPLRLAKRILNGRVKERGWRKKILSEFFTPELLGKAEYITQLAKDVPSEEGFRLADDYLKLLRNAKLVITSRIHCALPCLAMGVPVIFINGGFKSKIDNCRFDGIMEFFNRIEVDSQGNGSLSFDHAGKIGLDSVITNKDLHVPYTKALEERCLSFVKEGHKVLSTLE